MLQLIKFDLLVRGLAVSVVFVSTLIYYVLQRYFIPDYPVYKVASIASAVASLVVIAILSPILYRPAWKLLRKLGANRFQDLNGAWVGTIQPNTSGALEVRAVIRQSLLRTEIDLHGATVKSITLTATVLMEAGQYKLYYVYRAEPRDPDWAPYSGTTKLDLRVLANSGRYPLALSGQYYTDRDTIGTIELTQVGHDPLKDVSFY
ncbi:hypothetical protein Q3C01_14315 [Bradyrhizobium sp. UFLA05-109]